MGQSARKVEAFEPRARSRSEDPAPRKARAPLIRAGIVLGGTALLFGLILLPKYWPFSQAKIIHNLEESTSSRVQIASFHKTFFPRAGCVAEGVTFRVDGASNSIPLISIQKLTIQTSFMGLLHKHISSITADGTKIVIPQVGDRTGWPKSRNPSDIVIDELISDGAEITISARDPHSAPLRFEVHQFAFHDLGGDAPMSFYSAFTNPEPPGEIQVSGQVGPWSASLPQTSIQGSYRFTKANLAAFGGIQGTLFSVGKFRGTIQNIGVDGTTDVPDFGVTRVGHKVHLATRFQASVNGTNGNVILRSVNAMLGGTPIVSAGDIAPVTAGQSKTALINSTVREGHIQDLLYLFAKSPRPPLSGIVNFRVATKIPPDDRPFLRKVVLQGDFGIGGARFTSNKTQGSLNKLSAQAQGQKENVDPDSVVSDLKGHVTLTDGTASFSNLSFRVPGALAKMHGTYNLLNKRIDLHGILLMEATLPQATSGVKSFLLKALDPFLKKNHRGGAKIPIKITGTYDRPSYQSDPI